MRAGHGRGPVQRCRRQLLVGRAGQRARGRGQRLLLLGGRSGGCCAEGDALPQVAAAGGWVQFPVTTQCLMCHCRRCLQSHGRPLPSTLCMLASGACRGGWLNRQPFQLPRHPGQNAPPPNSPCWQAPMIHEPNTMHSPPPDSSLVPADPHPPSCPPPCVHAAHHVGIILTSRAALQARPVCTATWPLLHPSRFPACPRLPPAACRRPLPPPSPGPPGLQRLLHSQPGLCGVR